MEKQLDRKRLTARNFNIHHALAGFRSLQIEVKNALLNPQKIRKREIINRSIDAKEIDV